MNLRQKCKKLKKENEHLQKYIPGYPSPIIHVDHSRGTGLWYPGDDE